MPLIEGAITEHGAIITVTIGVSRARRLVLERNGMPVPEAEIVRAQLDTGAAIAGFTPAVFERLGIGPFQFTRIRTPSTSPDSPCVSAVYDVEVALVSGMSQMPLSVQAIASADFDRERDGDVHGIIGRDILDHCTFIYEGSARRFSLGY